MKKALYYALRRSYRSFHVIAVTTERNGHWWGRGLDSCVSTHGRSRHLVGRFDVASEAEAKVSSVNAIYEKHKPIIDAAREAMILADRAENREVEVFLGQPT